MIYKIEKSTKDNFNFVINDELHFSIVDFKDDLIVDYSCEHLTKKEVEELMNELVLNLIQAVENGSIQL